MHNFVTFTFPKITTQISKEGIEKKIFKGIGSWANVTKENMANYNNISDKVTNVITGHLSDITVLDVDSQTSYYILTSKHPEILNCYTVNTNKGYHIYFKYNQNIKTTTDAFINIPNIDIRNNGAFVVAPPTTYILLKESVATAPT